MFLFAFKAIIPYSLLYWISRNIPLFICMFDFHTLEMKYGSPVAYSLLWEMEKAARIASRDMAHFAPEDRLANALRVQDAMAGTGREEVVLQVRSVKATYTVPKSKTMAA